MGWPLAVQFPVSSNQVRNRPRCTTSPPTPSISTQSLYPDSVWSHQNKPTAECQDEILKDHGQSRGRQTQDRWHLLWYTENRQQDQDEADQLRSQI